MMKRILAVLALAAVFTVVLVSVASANQMVATQLKWRTHLNTYVCGGTGVFSDFAANTCDAIDSTISNRLGTQISVLDTTTAVNTKDFWRLPVAVMAAADTNMIYCTFNVYDSGSSATAADSVYIMCQASYDGKSWFPLTTLIGGTAGATASRLDQTQGGGTFIGALNKLGASGGTPSWAINYKFRAPVTDSADRQGIWRYPLLRWIVGFPDAVKYSVQAQVIYRTDNSGKE